MGPHVFACGNSGPDRCRGGGDAASMGPHVFACGNHAARPKGKERESMLQWGRTFLRAEIEHLTGDIPSPERGLQWGRTFLRAEIRAHGRAIPTAPYASMGPHVFACGNSASLAGPPRPSRLQWGRTFLRAEMRLHDWNQHRPSSFNGAARFCVRK